jgi:hypothetical protein
MVSGTPAIQGPNTISTKKPGFIVTSSAAPGL